MVVVGARHMRWTMSLIIATCFVQLLVDLGQNQLED
jgi:hypothetical protein